MNDVFVKDFTVDGKCSSCGKCCSNMLPMSKDEVIRIKGYIRQKGIKEQRHNTIVGTDMTCPFRDEANKKCLVYEVRPAICRQFMCNHNIEDIKKWKVDFHKKFDVVFMRNEFFGSTEDVDFFKNLLTATLLQGGYYG